MVSAMFVTDAESKYTRDYRKRHRGNKRSDRHKHCTGKFNEGNRIEFMEEKLVSRWYREGQSFGDEGV